MKLRAYLDDHAAQGLTAASLSVKAGLSNSAIRGWLSGKSKSPTISSARDVCKAMGTTLEEFLGVPQTSEEKAIAGLVSELPVHLLHLMIGYGQGLSDGRDQAPPAAREDEQ